MKENYSLTAAKKAGRKNYFTGKPCKRGHISKRLSANGACLMCEGERKRAFEATEIGKRKRRLKYDKYSAAIREKLENLPDGEYKTHLLRRRFWRRDNLPAPTRPMPKGCEICGKTEEQNGRALALDHCHETHTFRGWLCDHCNRGIGFLGDKLEDVRNALRYLEAWNASINPNYGDPQ